MKKILLLLIVFLGLYFAARVTLAWNQPNSDSTDRVSFSITKGMTLSNIADTLKKKGVIKDALVFRIYSQWNHVSSKYQAGDYVVLKNLTFAELVDILQSGKSQEIKITIPEGYTIAQIDNILAKKGLIAPGEFQKCANFCDLGFKIPSLEGYLFPSTYYIAPASFSSKNFLLRLYQTFQNQIEPFRADISKSGHSLDQIVIMASLIERESFGKEGMSQISGILWKRLREGMALGVDATTRYALNDWKRSLTSADFETDSPYNTRKRKGLPPTAIANPGIEALRAAVYPQASDYYYYLHDSSGKVHFSKTLEEHVQNKQKYLE